MKSTLPPHEPDCFDLNDWCVLKEPDFFAIVKYLSPTIQTNAIRRHWIEKGRPQIEEVIKGEDHDDYL